MLKLGSIIINFKAKHKTLIEFNTSFSQINKYSPTINLRTSISQTNINFILSISQHYHLNFFYLKIKHKQKFLIL